MEIALIIGAGIGQVDLIRKFKERNFFVITVSPDGDYPGLKIADEVWYVDIYDKETILSRCLNRNIVAVISDQNDLVMPTVAYIASKLGLPGNSVRQVLSYSNKNNFLNICNILKIPAPKSIAINNSHISEVPSTYNFPLIVKPEDSQSSIGVSKIEDAQNYEELVKKAIQNSRNKKAILQEYFEGNEIVCEGFIYKNNYYLIGFADRKYFNIPGIFLPCQTIFPSTIDDALLNRIVGYEKKLAEFIRPEFAIVHSEYLINEKTKEVKIVESALRGGGVHISSIIAPLFCGIDLTNLIIDCSLNFEIDLEKIFKNSYKHSAAYVCFTLPEGEIVSIEGIELLKEKKYIKYMDLSRITVGMQCKKMVNKGMRQGPIIVYAHNRSKLEEYIKEVQNILVVKVKKDNGAIESIVWS